MNDGLKACKMHNFYPHRFHDVYVTTKRNLKKNTEYKNMQFSLIYLITHNTKIYINSQNYAHETFQNNQNLSKTLLKLYTAENNLQYLYKSPISKTPTSNQLETHNPIGTWVSYST